MNGNGHYHSIHNQRSTYDSYNSTYDGDRRGATGSYPRHMDGNQWAGQENTMGSSYKTNRSERGEMSSSPEATRDEEGDSKKKRRIQQACKACSLRRVKCNGERPCQTCLKNNDDCTYGQPKKRGPAKGTTRGIRRDRDHQRTLSSSASTPNTSHTTTLQQDATNFARPHSPTSFNSATSLLALHNPHGHPTHPPPPLNGRGTAMGYREAHPHHTGEGSSMYLTPASPDDRDWSHDSASSKSRFVYRGTTSGWTAPTAQRSRIKDDQMSPPFRPSYTSPRPEQEGVSYSHRSNRTNHQNQFPPSLSNQKHPSNLPPLNRQNPLTSSAATTSSTTLPHHHNPRLQGSGKDHQISPRGREDSQMDELEIAEASLEFIFQEIHENKHDTDSNRRFQQSPPSRNVPSDQLERITLTRPHISEETNTQLFHVFWSGISLYWPLFYRKSYRDEIVTRNRIEEHHPLLFNAICSLAALIESESDGVQRTSRQENLMTHRQLSTIFYARARYHNIRSSQNPCLESAAALILLSLRESGAGHPTEASRYCWSACRMALDLGLHRHGELSQTSENMLSQVEDENRRRVFWCAYVLDKTLAAQFGRPPILRSVESDCPLPSIHGEDDEWMTWDQIQHHSHKANIAKSLQGRRIGVSSYFINGCQLAVICEAIIAKYNVVHCKQEEWQRGQGSQVTILHGKLARWMEATPDHLKWKPNEQGGHLPYVLHQQVWSQVCMILIHRPFILKGCGDPHINSHAECSKATRKICGLFRDWETLFDLSVLPSGSVYCLFTAATIALANTTSTEAEVAKTAKDQLVQYTRWLTFLSRTWNSASQHIAILQKLAAGIDPELAYHTIVATAQARDDAASKKNGLPSSPPFSTTTTKMEQQDASWSHVDSPYNINTAATLPPPPPSSSSSTSMANTQRSSNNLMSASTRDDFGLNQLQSVDAFWNDMPLGEDFQRWDQFTQAYFKPSSTMNQMGPPSDSGGGLQQHCSAGLGLGPPPTSINEVIPPPPYPISTLNYTANNNNNVNDVKSPHLR